MQQTGVYGLKDLLLNLGYNNLIDRGKFYQTSALYRGGDNRTALCIFKKDGGFKDYVTGDSGNLKKFILLHAEIDEKKINLDKVNVDEIIKNIDIQIDTKPKVKMENKIYPPEILLKLLPQHDYWIKRGISEDTIKLFKGGLAHSHKFRMRHTIPIYDESNNIIGFTGRYVLNIDNPNIAKWKHVGNKKNFIWPYHLNQKDIIDKNEVILVESPGCVFSLFEAGIKNVLCIFGLNISPKLINKLIAINPSKVIIATNNEESERGNNAAIGIQTKLAKFFDKNRVIIKLPYKKDFNEMLISGGEQTLKEWYLSGKEI